MSLQRLGLVASLAVAVLLLFAPQIGPLIHLDTSIVSEVLLFAIAAMSVNLLLGYTGLPAFGNAAFFGLGSYGAGLSIHYFNAGFFLAIVIGIAAALLGALLIGPFLLRRRGIYFGLLTIAFGQVFYFIAYRMTNITGGEDGMNFPRPLVHLGGTTIKIDDVIFYYLSYVVFFIALIAFWYLVRSPFGHTLIAIKQNEVRVRYLGLNSDRFIFVALIVAALYAGLAGALYGLLIMFTFPLALDWHQSGDFVLMLILGGQGSVWGPLVGALIYVVGKDIISTITPAWQIFLGGLFIACVLGFPKGLLGTTISALLARERESDDSAEAAAALEISVPR
ncbi:MAG: branched-chain amino acid ABC transporter permease [Candidatus Eremiobacteraeota bacterium]|nr:branched-chain amino acid ABC transporter permease [Candidatus Eremiobacteraeota bacterium]